MARSSTWKCQRWTGGAKCGAANLNKFRYCQACGKKRPPKKYADHLWALKLSYEDYVYLNGGPNCGICGKPPTPTRHNDRDHEHGKVGLPRGLLCPQCNQHVWENITLEWAKALVVYLERAEEFRRRLAR